MPRNSLADSGKQSADRVRVEQPRQSREQENGGLMQPSRLPDWPRHEQASPVGCVSAWDAASPPCRDGRLETVWQKHDFSVLGRFATEVPPVKGDLSRPTASKGQDLEREPCEQRCQPLPSDQSDLVPAALEP